MLPFWEGLGVAVKHAVTPSPGTAVKNYDFRILEQN